MALTSICPTCSLEVPTGVGSCPRDGTPLDWNEPTAQAVKPPDPLLGVTLGEYRVTERIGEGGMGLLYRGVQPLIGKTVAVKLLKPEIAELSGQIPRLVKEAQLINAIGHRGIVDVFGFGQLPGGQHYVVMEYLAGKPLNTVIAEKGPMLAFEAIPILDQVLAALGAAHAAGVVHRDIKPSNIFLVIEQSGEQYVKLLDFGLAKQVSAATGSAPQSRGLVVGTPEYMAPEQARGMEIGPASDLYSLGVVAFEMITGRLPFHAVSAIEIVLMHMERPPERPADLDSRVPAELSELILRLMAKEPAARPRSAEVARQELRRILKRIQAAETRPAAVHPPDAPAPGPPQLATQPAWVPPGKAEHPSSSKLESRFSPRRLVAVVLLLLALGAGGYYWAGSRGGDSSSPPTLAEIPTPPAPSPEEHSLPPPAPPLTTAANSRTGPERPRGPTRQSLLARLRRLRQRAEAKAIRSGREDPRVRQFLERASNRVREAKDEASLKRAAEYLDEIEQVYLR